jgi:hypothetical protein
MQASLAAWGQYQQQWRGHSDVALQFCWAGALLGAVIPFTLLPGKVHKSDHIPHA